MNFLYESGRNLTKERSNNNSIINFTHWNFDANKLEINIFGEIIVGTE